MKQFNTNFTDVHSFKEYIREEGIVDSKNNLIQIFTGITDKEKIQNWFQR